MYELLVDTRRLRVKKIKINVNIKRLKQCFATLEQQEEFLQLLGICLLNALISKHF